MDQIENCWIYIYFRKYSYRKGLPSLYTNVGSPLQTRLKDLHFIKRGRGAIGNSGKVQALISIVTLVHTLTLAPPTRTKLFFLFNNKHQHFFFSS